MAWNFGKILSNPGRPWLIRIFGAQKHINNLVLTQMGVHDILHIIQEIMYGIQDIMNFRIPYIVLVTCYVIYVIYKHQQGNNPTVYLPRRHAIAPIESISGNLPQRRILADRVVQLNNWIQECSVSIFPLWLFLFQCFHKILCFVTCISLEQLVRNSQYLSAYWRAVELWYL